MRPNKRIEIIEPRIKELADRFGWQEKYGWEGTVVYAQRIAAAIDRVESSNK